ncbi:MAG: hypothetical protein NC483_00275 [Ruminococcus sp.]|nr:hypothetical protein [Ruminococcus sp.]
MNLYQLLDLSPTNNIIEILNKFKDKCQEHPENTFKYTYALCILIDKTRKIFYDAALFHIDINTLYECYSKNETEEIDEADEYEIMDFIEWLDYFREIFFDTKFSTNNQNYHKLVTDWYITIVKLLDYLKSQYIHSFYLP